MNVLLPEKQPIPPKCFSTGRGLEFLEVLEVPSPLSSQDSPEGPSDPEPIFIYYYLFLKLHTQMQ